MKKLFGVLTFTVLVLMACNKEEMIIKPAVQPNETGQEAKYPGVGQALKTRFFDVTAKDHQLCVTIEMITQVNNYLFGIGELTKDPSTVGMEFSHNDDIAVITWRGVTHKFYKNGTSDWDGMSYPGEVPGTALIPGDAQAK